MNIRTVTYVSIIISGFIVGHVFPMAELIGCGPSTLFLALFLPYFGWKKIVKITLVLLMVTLPLTVPILIEDNRINAGVIEMTNEKIRSIPNLPANEKFEIPNVFSNPIIFSLICLGEIMTAFLVKLGLIASVHRLLKKTSIFHIIAF